MCLVFSSRKKKLLRGCHHMTEKGFHNSEISLKTNHKKCQPKLALLLFLQAITTSQDNHDFLGPKSCCYRVNIIW